MNALIVVFSLGAVANANAGIIADPGLYSPYAAPGYFAAPYASVASLVQPGQDLEGHFIPDNLEKLYDDGSYKPELRTILLSPSRYVLTEAGSGIEGQYVHDNSEILYDNGSYKPEIRADPLVPSPYGLTVAGSGLEGQYVHDHTEKLYDDGSYTPGVHH